MGKLHEQMRELSRRNLTNWLHRQLICNPPVAADGYCQLTFSDLKCNGLGDDDIKSVCTALLGEARYHYSSSAAYQTNCIRVTPERVAQYKNEKNEQQATLFPSYALGR